MQKKTLKLLLYFTLFFLFSTCINLVHPVTPTYIRSLNLPDYYFGFFYSLMSLGQVIGAMIFGYISDKIGRKWLIVIGIIGYALAQAGFGYINQWPVLILVFRILSGIFVAAPNTLFVSMCLDFSDEKDSVKNLSILSFCSILGASAGYGVGGLLYDYAHLSIQNVFLAQVLLGIITALIFAIGIHDVMKEKVKTKSKFSFKNFRNLNGLMYLLLGSLFILTIGQNLINKYIDPYIIDTGFNPSDLGNYVLITGIVGATSNLIVIPFIKKLKHKKLAVLLVSFIAISIVMTLTTFLLPSNNLIYLLFSTHMIYLILKALIMPLEQNEIASYTNDDNKGQIMGARHTLLSIGNVIGPLIGSAVYVKKSPLVFVVAACFLLASLIMYISYFSIKYHKKENTVNK